MNEQLNQWLQDHLDDMIATTAALVKHNGVVETAPTDGTPYGKAVDMPPINRRLSGREYKIVKEKILDMGFENCYFQSKDSAEENFIPDFNLEGVDLL